MTSNPTIFDEPHHQSLELLCARALASGDIATAFKLADRRCRIAPLPEPHCYVLRAEALFRMGEKAAAVSNIVKALEIAPDDIAANRRMLAWSDIKRRRTAALSLIAHDRDFDALRRAVTELRGRGRNAFANLKVFDAAVRGWAAWDSDGPISVTIDGEGDSVTTLLAADPAHPLTRALGHAVDIALPRPAGGVQRITVMAGGAVVFSLRTPRHDEEPARIERAAPAAAAADEPVTVIVPVYADYAATKACLDSLLAPAQARSRHRVIIVNDASSEPRIEKLLAQAAARRPELQLLTNASNLGFVGSVNRGLEEAGGGDVILLNADTVVPAGFVARLAAAARSASDIGTVTPLSNNGEFTSFPVPNSANPLPSAADIAAIDRSAERVNAGRVADIPNGIGFCLYITRDCLDAVGALSEHYHRGYLEDVDFCLRARERGLRNVCAPSVFVGHAGSRSFGDEKRSLVVRNLAAVERRFPNYRAECAAFVKADPLRAARAAIERALPAARRRPRVLITGAGGVGEVIHERARNLHADSGAPVVVLALHRGPQGMTATIKDSGEAPPQSLRFALDRTDEREALFEYLRHARPSRIEFADPANTPDGVATELLQLNVPYDIFIADAGLLQALGQESSNEAAKGTARQHRRVGPVSAAVRDNAAAARLWRKLTTGAAEVFAPGGEAEAFAVSVLPQRGVIRLPFPDGRKRRAASRRRNSVAASLGIIPLRASIREQRLLHGIVRRLKAVRDGLAITVLGGLPDDFDLMRFANTFVTGAVATTELSDLVRTYGLRSLFVCSAAPLFGHPLEAAAADCGLPMAFLDWSHRGKSTPLALAIDPRLPVDEIADALGQWAAKR